MSKRFDYKTEVLNYLVKHKNTDVTRKTLLDELSISKSRLTEVLHSIRDDGYVIISPNRSGIVRLVIDEGSSTDPLSTIKNQDIRKWLILLILSKYEKLTFKEIISHLLELKDENYIQAIPLSSPSERRKVYDDNMLIRSIRNYVNSTKTSTEIYVAKDILSITAVRNDISSLQKEGLIISSKCFNQTSHRYQTKYLLTSNAPIIALLSDDSLYEFCQQYDEITTTITESTTLKQLYKRMSALVNYDGNAVSQLHFGKENEINQEQISVFNSFISHPYKTKILELETRFKDRIVKTRFATGLLFYSVETGGFYALGKNIELNRILSLRIDWIFNIRTLDEENMEFHNQGYYDIYNEMFAAQYEPELQHVKVLVQDFKNVLRRFQDLTEIRTNATLRKIDSPPIDCPYTYVYEDNIRGLSDFSRYLRRFGKSVLALEPLDLNKRMIYTYERVLEKNEEYNV